MIRLKGLGKEFFNRYNIFFFQTREELIKAEKCIIDEDFFNRADVYNVMAGGTNPPTYFGEKNSNYGNKWTQEQKDALSKYFLENYDRSGANNNRATKTMLLDLITYKKIEFETIGDAGKFLELKEDTARKYANQPRLLRKRYLAIKEKDLENINVFQLIKESANHSYGRSQKNK